MSDVWRIFVIIGDESLNQGVVEALHKDGYAVQGVVSGMDAVRVLWSEEYDVVLCDLDTPGADGFELLQWLRAYRPNTRMIMLGEAEAEDLRVKSLESGAVSYLTRPLDIRLLKEELRRLLQQTGFSASLDSFDLLDVIQIINMSRKSITLLINTGLEERGTLRFQNGELIWAEYGVLRSEEAFFALAAHKNGTVTEQVWNEQVTSNVTQPLSHLILQALQYRSKYAKQQQYSGEIESVPSPSSFVTPVQHGDEVDDSPFVFSDDAELQSVPPAASTRPFQPASPATSTQPFQSTPPATSTQPFQSAPPVTPTRPFPQVPPTTPAQPFSQAIPAIHPSPSTPESFAVPRPVSSPLPQLPGQSSSSLPDFSSEQPATKEWWESTAHFASVNFPSDSVPQSQATQKTADFDDDDESQAPTIAMDNTALNALLRQISQPSASQPAVQPPAPAVGLPSWLTDQPTSGLPVIHAPNQDVHSDVRSAPPGGSMRQSSIPATPAVPVTPASPENTDWVLPVAEPLANPVQLPTGQLPAVPDVSFPFQTVQSVQNPSQQSPAQPSPLSPTQGELSSGLHPSAPDWHSGIQRAVPPSSGNAANSGPLPSLQAQNLQFQEPSVPFTYSAPLPVVEPPAPNVSSNLASQDGGDDASSSDIMEAQRAARRNYASLVAALQSLGYSVNGFMAAAIATIDGQLIAQVAVNDMDVSQICEQFSTIQKSVWKTCDQTQWGMYESTVITNADRYLLVRMVGSEKKAFQVLITTREAQPQDCLEIMANVDGAISTALR